MKTTKSFQAVRPGDVYPSTIKDGEDVEGRLAEIAAEIGAMSDEDVKTMQARAEDAKDGEGEPKRDQKKSKGAAPENKARS